MAGMGFVKIGLAANFPPGSAMEALVGDGTYAICNVGGEFYAVDGICPHSGGPLGHGALHGTTLVCPWHAWDFDCRTGVSEYDPGLAVASFPVKIEDGEIFIDVP
jgi:nitrite reductase/ring-hydroxylating ferredoxin subunit